ncbi:MAG: hypothetical protein QOK15_439, partial [Nocardioidaceae bacterium]|nr:hypothetical protein [Nocardioidaceae bacterium]
AGVAVALGVYGRVHTPAYASLPTFGFSSAPAFKAWTATVVLALALVQLAGALWMYGRIPGLGPAPSWLGTAHRATGSVAFLLSLPVAAFCLYGIGFAPTPFTARTLVHSVAGCSFYGAFAAKVLLVHTRKLPGWALPVAGGLLFTAVVAAWLTSALWFFRITGLHG